MTMVEQHPSPLHERALDRGSESYRLTCAGERAATEPGRPCIHGPESRHAHAVEMAHDRYEHFRRRHPRGGRQCRRRMLHEQRLIWRGGQLAK